MQNDDDPQRFSEVETLGALSSKELTTVWGSCLRRTGNETLL